MMDKFQDITDQEVKNRRTSLDFLTQSDSVKKIYNVFKSLVSGENFNGLMAFHLGYLTLMTLTG